MATYYSVIGSRDYIKLNNTRHPFWEFLDNPPDGWLTSLAYKRTDIPTNRPRLFDCGAWTYRKEQTPQLNGHLVTPEWVLTQYQQIAQAQDIIIAPDHMLIKAFGNIEFRRSFNRQSALKFLQLTKTTKFKPMAVAHGLNIKERLEYAMWLVGIGYKAIALGGMAGRANAQNANIEAVKKIRAKLPYVHLHILGLSSPLYAKEWHKLGVNSFDGSSHFKKAFTAGIFYTHHHGNLRVCKAAKTERGKPNNILEPITAPLCHCQACSTLRAKGIDTRTYGSNQNNMGRAAHNLNMLMRAHKWHFNEGANVNN